MTPLVGCTTRPSQTGLSTQQAADDQWINTVGLPLQIGRTYNGTGAYPTTIGTLEQTLINSGIAMLPCFKPTYPFVAGEVTQLVNTLNMYLTAGAVIPAVVLYPEVNNGNVLTASQYLSLVSNFQSIRSTARLYVNFAGYHQNTQAAYWNASLFDGVGVDFYEADWNTGRTLATADSIARAAGCPMALFEFGSNPDSTASASFIAMLNHFTSVFTKRMTDGQANLSFSYFNGAATSPNPNTITSATDSRIPYIRSFFNAVTAPSSHTNPYDVCSAGTQSTTTTLTQTVGTGTVGSPQGTVAGDLVVVNISAGATGQTVTGVTDSKGNSYAQVNSYSAGTTQNQWVWASLTTTALVAGTDTITVTFSVSTATKSMIVRGVPGVSSATPDKALVVNGNSTAPNSGSTTTLSSSAEYVVGVVANPTGGGAPTTVSFGTKETFAQANYLTVFDELVSLNTAQTASATLPSSSIWSASITTFRLQSGGPIVTTTSLPSGATSTAYSATVAAKYGALPYTWTLNSGTLPTGLTLNSNGTITGTPSGTGTSTFTVKVTDNNGNTAISASLSITIAATALTITTGALPSGVTGLSYTATETESGGSSPFTWALQAGSTPLPPGLSLSSAGVISGTPTTLGTYPFTVQVTDATNAVATASQSITINAPGPVVTAIAAIAIGDPGVNNGPDQTVIAHGISTAPSVTSGTLAQGEESCIAFIADTNAGGAPTWGNSFALLQNQADGGSNLRLSAASLAVTATTAVTASGTITSAPWTAALITEAALPIAATIVLSDGVANEPYNQTLQAVGGLGGYTWTLTGSLPPGLTLSAGVISGTPTTPGSYPFSLTVQDAHGFSSSISEDIVILASGGSPAATQPMGGNLLPVGDSSFETGIGSWVADTNASGITTSANAAFTGSHSLRWTATASGPTGVKTGAFTPVTAGKTYVVSAYLLAVSNQSPGLHVGVHWYNASNVLISSSENGGAMLAAPLAWQGVQAPLVTPTGTSFVAPAGATKAQVFVSIDQANAGDLNYLDLAFFAQSNAQVLIDFANPAFGASSAAGANFMDVSPWVRMETGITIGNRGRQDAISEASAGQAYFPVENDGGWFTKDNMNTPAGVMGGSVTTQRRCQINLSDETGTWHTRFDGQIAEYTYTIDPTGNTNIATVYVADILAELTRQDPLQCWTKQQVLAGNPSLHWSLQDQPPAAGLFVLASETSGNNGPPLKVIKGDVSTIPTITWADTSGGVETLADAAMPGRVDGSAYWPAGQNVPTSQLRGLDSGAVGPYTTPLQGVYLVPNLSVGSGLNQFVSNNGYYLEAGLPTALAPTSTPAGDFSVEIWGMPDPALSTNGGSNYGPYTAFSLGSSRRGSPTIVVGLFQSGGAPQAGAKLYANSPSFAAKQFAPAPTINPTASAVKTLPLADLVQRPHHFVLTVQGDPVNPVATVYVDGLLMGSFDLDARTLFDTITVGGAYGGTGCWYGGLSLCSIYPYQLPQSQITLNCQLGQYGMWESPTDDCIAQLATFAGIPAFWNTVTAQHNGLSLTEYFDITGGNAYAAMTVYEQTEGGLLFVNAAGQLCFHTRDWRAGYGAAKLTLPPDSYSEQLGLQVIDTYQVNENAIASATLPGGAAYVNTTSQAQYGNYAPNAVGSPAQLAHFSWSRAFGAYGLQAFQFWPDPNMQDAAAWPANIRSEPWFALGGITVNLLTPDPAWGINVSNLYGVEIDDVISLGGTLPTSFPNSLHSNEFFIEGVSEVISQNSRTITFYVSPAATQRAWIPGDATYGVLGSTTRVGVSSTDLSTPQAFGKDVSHDGGPPYWAPTFSAQMNSPAQLGGFVGNNDIRGLIWPLQKALQPPILAAGAVGNNQNFNSGAQDDPALRFDTLACDSENGMGIMPNYCEWYVCLVPGYYEIDAGVCMSRQSSLANDAVQGWIAVAAGGAQALAQGIGDPFTVGQYICPVGETVRRGAVSLNAITAPSTRLYLGLGDMIALCAEQDTGSAWGSGVDSGGSRLTLRWVGLATQDDRVEINSSISTGGSVNTTPPPAHGQFVYKALHTYSHEGFSSKMNAWGLRNKDGNCYVGQNFGDYSGNGSQFTLIRLNWTQMQTDLAGKTILSVTLQGHNLGSYYSSGMTLLGGYYFSDNEGAPWQPNKQVPLPAARQWTQQFNRGQNKTFTIPAAQFQQLFVQQTAHGIFIGDNATQDLHNYGWFAGGPNSWTLTVNY